MKQILFQFGAGDALAQSLVGKIGCEPGELDRRQFPDGESYVRLVTPVEKRDVILLASLANPDKTTLPLLFTADAARQHGARTVGLIAPYLAYMRQDKAFQAGEAVTSVTYAHLLSSAFDWLVTVDPHLHRYDALDAVYSIPSIATTAAGPIARWIEAHVERPFLIGPDVESAQWVEQIAELAHAPSAIFRKTRRGDFDIVIDGGASHIPAGATPVIVDDIASSGRTMVEAVKALQHGGHAAPVCVLVHALFAGDAYHTLLQAGPAAIVSTNTVPHPSNAIDIAEVIGEAVLRALGTTQGSKLDPSG